jgi:hypothetical protein
MMSHRYLGALAVCLCFADASKHKRVEATPKKARARPVLLVVADDLRPQFSYLGFEDVRVSSIRRAPAPSRIAGTNAER